MKSDHIRNYFGPYFPTFGLNIDQNSSEYGHFIRSVSLKANCHFKILQVKGLQYKCFKKQPPEVFYNKAVLKNFSTLTGKYMRSSLFLIKLWHFRSATKRLQHRCFLVNIAKFLKKLILKKICERLLLNNVKRNYSPMKIVK